jgi:hypothetical protein
MRIISFIDQPDVIKKILQHLGLWEESHAPPRRNPPACSELVEPIKEITFDPSYSQLIEKPLFQSGAVVQRTPLDWLKLT